MRVFGTKYALTVGIEEFESDISNNMVVRKQDGWPIYYHSEGRQWHRTRAEARERAEKMRSDKIASLKKQLEKLKKLNFGV
jgi:hypothetical protein